MLSREDRAEIYRRAIEKYGEDMQLIVALEEMAELAKEICKRQRGDGVLAHLSEEMADVMICLEQMEMILDNHLQVQKIIQEKTERLAGRLGRA